MKNMKFLLKLLTTTTLASAAVVTVVACAKPAAKQAASKADLSSKKMGPTTLTVTESQIRTYEYLKKEIKTQFIDTLQGKDFVPDLSKGFIVELFKDQNGNEKIVDTDYTVSSEAKTDFWIRVTAAADNKNWTGTTQLSHVTLSIIQEHDVKKANLSEINSLTVTLNLDTTKKYSDLNSYIKAAIESKNANKTFTEEPTFNYYDAAAEGKEITANSQQEGLFWVVVTAADSDKTWTGSTGNINLELRPNIITATEQIDIATALNSQNNELNLGNFIFTTSAPTVSQLLNAINSKNQMQFTSTDLEFSAITASSAIVSGKGTYKGQLRVEYKWVKDLSRIISNSEIYIFDGQSNSLLFRTIDWITSRKTTPTHEMIIKAINERNGTQFTNADLKTEINKSKNIIKITNGNKSYSGTVNINYKAYN